MTNEREVTGDSSVYSCRIFLSLLIITFTPGKCRIKDLTTSRVREENVYLNMILVSSCNKNSSYGIFYIKILSQ